MLSATNALSKLTLQGYDADCRPNRTVAQIGTQWLVNCQTYTPSGKLLKSWGPAQTAAATTCPSAASPTPVAENLTVGKGGNRVTQIAYYADDRVQNVKRVVGTARTQTYAAFTYTPNGLLLTQKDAWNNLAAYQYDGHSRKLKTRYPGPVTANASLLTMTTSTGWWGATTPPPPTMSAS